MNSSFISKNIEKKPSPKLTSNKIWVLTDYINQKQKREEKELASILVLAHARTYLLCITTRSQIERQKNKVSKKHSIDKQPIQRICKKRWKYKRLGEASLDQVTGSRVQFCKDWQFYWNRCSKSYWICKGKSNIKKCIIKILLDKSVVLSPDSCLALPWSTILVTSSMAFQSRLISLQKSRLFHLIKD